MYMESDIIQSLYSVNEAVKEDYFNWNIGNQAPHLSSMLAYLLCCPLLAPPYSRTCKRRAGKMIVLVSVHIYVYKKM